MLTSMLPTRIRPMPSTIADTKRLQATAPRWLYDHVAGIAQAKGVTVSAVVVEALMAAFAETTAPVEIHTRDTHRGKSETHDVFMYCRARRGFKMLSTHTRMAEAERVARQAHGMYVRNLVRSGAL